MLQLELRAGNYRARAFLGGYQRLSQLAPEEIEAEVGPRDEVVLICDNSGDEREDANSAFQKLRMLRRRVSMKTTEDLFRSLVRRR